MLGLLDGLRVLDLTVWRPGPYATQLLAELGADVLKVEPPGGDPMRVFPGLFDILGAGKRSVVLDLKDGSQRARFLELARDSDAVVESYRPGVADRLGVGAESVRAVNPRVVYCSISGYGADGPLAPRPGHDVNYLATSGMLAPRGGDPIEPTVPLADLTGGLAGAFAIAAACLGAQRSGTGERIDLSITDVLATWVGPFDVIEQTGIDEPMTGAPGYGVFETADGRHVALGITNEDHFWVGLCDALELDDAVRALDRRDRTAATHTLNARIAERIKMMPLDAMLARFDAHDVPASAVITRAEMLRSSHLRARGTVVEGPDHAPTMGPLLLLESFPARAPIGAPELDANAGEGWRADA